ncbi:uncharacterized protein LOC110862956 [Folsomia candida]|uniref:uncharacterized protein LOC110862956 n=1 Tax=Folsomia candida TaxID=158441 RepID=UPI000B8F05E0|nr:uncharacterized protein LOC110862956 [Folsomia candida]
MTKVALIFLVLVVMATSAVQGSTLNENKKGELKSKLLEGGLDWECPSYCDYCTGSTCYYYDYYYGGDFELAVGWIVAISITSSSSSLSAFLSDFASVADGAVSQVVGNEINPGSFVS